MNAIATTHLIEKEEVSSLHFPSDQVEISKEEISQLKRKLRKAMILGNLHHNKIKIVFRDDTEIKEVRTTIWATGEKHVVLKQGITIPIHRILDVRL